MTKENEEINVEEVTKRLDVIIYLLLEQKRQAGVSKKQIINELSTLGLKDWEIARILGKTRSYVSSELTQIKKPNKKQGGDKSE
jgi:hypothetical protein